ncbi:MAG: EamA family transporter [Actinobacteria bacterium]|uniref:EamA family transporter n=1 Tax=Candidatus Fonsibacter lacus TaxID=2576439 RepID=A0A965LKN6_9PROT|nr:EamA family transporter [Candidatus Fonsibacter lacus]
MVLDGDPRQQRDRIPPHLARLSCVLRFHIMRTYCALTQENTRSLVGPLLALISSATWGVADFLGGLASRKTQIARVLPISYLSGAIAVTIFAFFLIPGEINQDSFIYGFFAAFFGVPAIALLYIALSRGPMGIVSPITALMAGLVPVITGLLRGDQVSGIGFFGMGLAALSVILVSQEQKSDTSQRISLSTLAICVSSGFLIGSYLTVLGLAPTNQGIWTSTIARWFGFLFVFAFFLLRLNAVLASLYPAATALLARYVLHEKLKLVQNIGVVLALVAAACLTMA